MVKEKGTYSEIKWQIVKRVDVYVGKESKYNQCLKKRLYIFMFKDIHRLLKRVFSLLIIFYYIPFLHALHNKFFPRSVTEFVHLSW